jgi:hypothetical protein
MNDINYFALTEKQSEHCSTCGKCKFCDWVCDNLCKGKHSILIKC